MQLKCEIFHSLGSSITNEKEVNRTIHILITKYQNGVLNSTRALSSGLSNCKGTPLLLCFIHYCSVLIMGGDTPDYQKISLF